MVGAVVDDRRIARGATVTAVVGHAAVMATVAAVPTVVLIPAVMRVPAVVTAVVAHRLPRFLRIRTHRRGVSRRSLVSRRRGGRVGGVVLCKSGTCESKSKSCREKHPGFHCEPPC